jgi:hypothetical protein
MLESKYQLHLTTPSDINEHMSVLRDYATKCTSVTELGVRTGVSIWAWLDAKVPCIRAYDLNYPPADELQYIEQFASEQNLDFKFIQADVRTIEIEPTDLLFIDTLHTYNQLKLELLLHSSKVRKYIIFHDTTLYGLHGEDGSTPALQAALFEFLGANAEWSFDRIFTHNNGLSIFKRD